MLRPRNRRFISIAAVATSLILLGLSSYRYGLAAQAGIVISIIPLLFAGLLLGRVGVWATLGCYLPILLLGAWVDLNGEVVGMQSEHEVLSNLMQPLLGSLIIALILDRLIMEVEVGKRQNRDLIMLCERLGKEIHEREQSQLQLIHSQRVDALGKLASNVAHDFNNLLSIVLGYARRAQGVIGDNAEARHFLYRIDAAVSRGQDLTSRLLTLVRDDDYSVERFDVNEALEALTPMLRALFAPAIVFQVDTARTALPIVMDRDGFEAMLLNIAKNAGDALDGVGRFRLITAVVDGKVLIRVEDTGQGMSDSVAARIFEPFYTTKPRGQGTGIGLAVAYRVVTEARGSIEVESEPGVGTIFTIRFPLAAGLKSDQAA